MSDPQNSRRSRGRPRDWHDKTQQNTIKSLDRALSVFKYLSLGESKPLTQLAEETKQSPATVYRILITLQGQGLVEFDPEDQVWHIGPQAFVIGSSFLRRTSLVERARPIMRKLMETTGETANLGIEREGKVLFLNQVETHESIRAFFPPGTLSDMHSSGIGKTLLAHMDPDRRYRIIKKMHLDVYTKFTITNADALNHDLNDIKKRGYSIDNEERNLGMRCIAAPVFDFNREVIAGISVSGPTSRVGIENLPKISVAVMHAAAALTEAIAGVAPAG